MRKLWLLLFFFVIKISAQTEVKGIIFSSHLKKGLKNANILLENDKAETQAYSFSKEDGSFSINTKLSGDFKLRITAPNYSTEILSINLNNTIVDLKQIFLNKVKEEEIKEVIITRKKSITIKKDTVEYLANTFASGTELNVEDLLKKLPGIKVESNGKIKFGNKEVERVMVENDDLFETGYQLLTQNMPSKPIEKVQVLEGFSKNKLLKGIENSESIAINLTLKENEKSRWFGNILASSTSYIENMYQVKFNLMNFSKRKKVYILYNGNNIGVNEMNGVEYMMKPTSGNSVENLGENITSLSAINLHQKNFQFEDRRTNFNNDKLLSLNYIYGFKNDWKLRFIGIFNHTENKNYVNSLYNFKYEDLAFINREDKTWKQNNQNIVGKLELTKEFKKNASIEFYTKVSSLKEDNDNYFIFNDQMNSQQGNNKLFINENKFIYTKKKDSSNALVFVAKYIFQKRPYSFYENNDIIQEFFNTPEAVKVKQNILSEMSFGGFKASYLKKYTEEEKIEIQLGDEFRKDLLNSDLALINSADQNIDFESTQFINNRSYSQNSIFLQIKYQNKIKKIKYNLGVLNQLISSDLNSSKQTGFAISPYLSIEYENKRTGNFRLVAERKISTVSINDIYTNLIYQGNRNFKQSSLDFNTLPDYNIGFVYNLGNILSEYLNLNFNLYTREQYIADNVIVNPNYSINQNILLKNSTTFTTNLELRKYIKIINSRISLLNSFLSSSYQNAINNKALINTNFENIKTGVELKSGWTKKINFELGYELAFNKIKSDVNVNKYIDQKGFVNLFYSSNNIRLETNYEYYKFGNTARKGTDFLDFKLEYMFKRQNMNLFFKASNLLNSKTFQRYSINNVSESFYTQRLMPLNCILGINKNF